MSVSPVVVGGTSGRSPAVPTLFVSLGYSVRKDGSVATS